MSRLRSTFPFLMLLAVLSMQRSVTAQSDLPDLVERVKPSIVTVETYSALGQRLGYATGFFIDETKFITTRHVIKDAGMVLIVLNNQKRFSVSRIIAEDVIGDLVMLEVDMDQAMKGLIRSSDIPREGEDIFVIGGPLGIEKTVTRGIISGWTSHQLPIEMLQISAAISPGSSGSPVMNMKGEVVGIAAAKFIEGESMNLAIPVSRLFQLDPNPRPFADWAREQLLKQGKDESPAESGGAPDPLAPIAINAQLAKFREAIVSIIARDSDGISVDRAAGFFYAPGRVLTSRHLFTEGRSFEVVLFDGTTQKVIGVVGDDVPGNIIALDIRSTRQDTRRLEISTRRPYREEPLIIASEDHGAKPLRQVRITMSMTDLPTFGPLISVGPLDDSYVSGQPAVSRDGRAVGIVARSGSGAETLRYLIPAGRILSRQYDEALPIALWLESQSIPGNAITTSAIHEALPFICTEDWSSAVDILQRTAQDREGDLSTTLVLALCRNYLSDWPELVAQSQRAIEMNPASSLAHFLLGIGYTRQIGTEPATALELAREAFRKAIELDPNYNYHSYIQLAAVLGDFDELEQSVTVMMRAVTLWPDRSETHNMLSAFYTRRSSQLFQDHQFGLGHKFRKLSLQEAARTIELAPYASWAYRQFSLSAAMNEAYEPAINAARRAVALAPGDPIALDNLSRIYLISKDLKKSLETCELLRKIDPAAADKLLKIIQSRSE